MTNDQSYAYTQFALCKFVESGVITKETMSEILREVLYSFDVLGEAEIINRGSARVQGLPKDKGW